MMNRTGSKAGRLRLDTAFPHPEMAFLGPGLDVAPWANPCASSSVIVASNPVQIVLKQ